MENMGKRKGYDIQWQKCRTAYDLQIRMVALLYNDPIVSNPNTLDFAPKRFAMDEFQLGKTFEKRRSPDFIGREYVLLHLEDILHSSSNSNDPKIAVVYGTGGFGKTQLALEYAERFDYDYKSIFWIDASHEGSVQESITSSLQTIERRYTARGLTSSPRYELIYKALNQPQSQTTNNDAEELRQKRRSFLDWLSFEDNRSWLMIIDNLDYPENVDPMTLVPQVSWGSIIITSRRTDLIRRWDMARSWKPVNLLEMDKQEALKLLMKSSQMNVTPSDPGRFLA
jgi:hypothetical protein